MAYQEFDANYNLRPPIINGTSVLKQTRQRIGIGAGFVEVWYRRRLTSLLSFSDFPGLIEGTVVALLSGVSAASVAVGAGAADAFCVGLGFGGFRRERTAEEPCLRGFKV